jgi:integrase
VRIDTKRGRAALEIRPAPYFEKLAKGRALGYRKLGVDRGTWVARYTSDVGRTPDGKLKLTLANKSLAEWSPVFVYDQAVEAARAWFKDMDSGITGMTEEGEVVTVERACRRYVDDRRRVKGDAAANDADKRFERTVYGSEKRDRDVIAGMKVAKVRAHHISAWRSRLEGLSKGSVNRTTTALRAALLLSVNDGLAGAEVTLELRKVKQYKNASNRRSLFLDRAQRRALIDASKGAVRNLIEAAALTGCRAGELTNALCKHFDARQKSLTVNGKTGQRAVLLAPSAIGLFNRLTERRKPDDFLLVRDDGKQWQHSDWDELVRDAAEAAKLPAGTVLYTLRHSWITEALMGGLSTLEVGKITGTSLVMIQQHYGHLVSTSASKRLAKLQLT